MDHGVSGPVATRTRSASAITRLLTGPCTLPAPALADLGAAPDLPMRRPRTRRPRAIVVPSTPGGVRITDPDDDRRAAAIVVTSAGSAIAVLLTIAVSTLLPGTEAVGGLAIGFLGLTGAFAGYATWRWVRWVRHCAERMHWSVIAAAGATITASELYGAAGIAAARSGFVERLTALAGFGFAAALTVAVTGVASLITYHRSVTDAQLSHWARRFA